MGNLAQSYTSLLLPSHPSQQTSPSFHSELSIEGVPWQFSGYDSALPLQGAWVRSLVGELRFHSLAKNQTKTTELFVETGSSVNAQTKG